MINWAHHSNHICQLRRQSTVFKCSCTWYSTGNPVL